MAECEKCGQQFVPHQKARLQRFCSKKCCYQQWVSKNRSKLNANVRRYRARRYIKEGRWRDEGPKSKALKLWMAELKSKPCHDCGQSFPTCCMDFDHRKGEHKEYNVGSMFAHHYGRTLIETELAKCDLVCANCHRILTQNRGTGSARVKNTRLCSVSQNT
jgi:hypothetical protein